MEGLEKRLDALEQETEQLKHQTRSSAGRGGDLPEGSSYMSRYSIAVTAVFLAGLILFSAGHLQASEGSGILFGTEGSGGSLFRISQTDGVATLVGPMGGPFPALATDPLTGIMYAGRGAGMPSLYIVNKATGATTLVGSTGLGFAAFGGMDFGPHGVLYATVNVAGDGGTGSDHLAIINKATGAATIVGPFGTCTGVVIPTIGAGTCTIEGIEAIAFDRLGTLWGAKTTRGRAGHAGLYVINPFTGRATFVSPILDASNRPLTGGVTSLQFRCDGVLFGGSARGIAANDGGRLIQIDPATGRFNFVGTVSATGGESLAALAFESGCHTIHVKPGSEQNSIDLRNDAIVPVTVPGTPTLNVESIVLSSIVFGPAGATPVSSRYEDANGDSRLDLILQFETERIGLTGTSTQACLSANLVDHGTIMGCDPVRVID